MRKEYADMTLAELSIERGTLQGYIMIAVTQARRGGSTWAAIASSLGVTTSEAHRRYSWLDKNVKAEQLPGVVAEQLDISETSSKSSDLGKKRLMG